MLRGPNLLLPPWLRHVVVSGSAYSCWAEGQRLFLFCTVLKRQLGGELRGCHGNPGWRVRKKLLRAAIQQVWAQKLAGLKEEIQQGLLKNDSDCMGGL